VIDDEGRGGGGGKGGGGWGGGGGGGGGGGLVEQVRIRRQCGPLCSKLVAAVSGVNPSPLYKCA